MGLDLGNRKKNTTFKHRMSARNVYIHETRGDPEEIRLIERAHPECCVDLERCRDQAARLEAIARERGE